MSVLVTGVTGFLGAEILAELLERKAGLVIGWGRDRKRIEALKKRFAADSERLRIEPRDVLDPHPLSAGVDTVIHAAAKRPPTVGTDPTALTRVNVEGTRRVVDLAKQAGCHRLLYVSTQAVYGSEGAPWTEDAPLHPETPYAMSKRDGEVEVLRATGLDVTILRISRLYGATPFSRWDELPGRFARAVCRGELLTIHGTGEQRFDLLHVRDAARCVAALVSRWDRVEQPVFNVGAGSSVSLNALVDLLSELAQSYGCPPVTVCRIPDHPGTGTLHLELDTSRIRRAVGWSPEIDLKTGLSEYLACLTSTDSSCAARQRDGAPVNADDEHLASQVGPQ